MNGTYSPRILFEINFASTHAQEEEWTDDKKHIVKFIIGRYQSSAAEIVKCAWYPDSKGNLTKTLFSKQ